jgi:hypothetical protein
MCEVSIRRLAAAALLAAGAALAGASPADAQKLMREPAPGELRLGQRVLVDDGSCPAGQIKQVTGARLTSAGVERTRACVPVKQRR